MSKPNFEADLQKQLSELDKQKQPERDLWAGIEIALANEKSPNELAQSGGQAVALDQRPKLFAIAASVLLVGVLTWQGLQPAAPDYNGTDLVEALSSQHQEQKQALLVKFQDQPALTQNWQTQLQELDDAASAIKAALAQDPDNVALLRMLQNVHQQQIDLIERVHSPKWRQL